MRGGKGSFFSATALVTVLAKERRRSPPKPLAR